MRNLIRALSTLILATLLAVGVTSAAAQESSDLTQYVRSDAALSVGYFTFETDTANEAAFVFGATDEAFIADSLDAPYVYALDCADYVTDEQYEELDVDGLSCFGYETGDPVIPTAAVFYILDGNTIVTIFIMGESDAVVGDYLLSDEFDVFLLDVADDHETSRPAGYIDVSDL